MLWQPSLLALIFPTSLSRVFCSFLCAVLQPSASHLNISYKFVIIFFVTESTDQWLWNRSSNTATWQSCVGETHLSSRIRIFLIVWLFRFMESFGLLSGLQFLSEQTIRQRCRRWYKDRITGNISHYIINSSALCESSFFLLTMNEISKDTSVNHCFLRMNEIENWTIILLKLESTLMETW